MLKNSFLSCFVEIKMNICNIRGIPLPKWVQMVRLQDQLGCCMASVLSSVHQALKQVPNAQFMGVESN